MATPPPEPAPHPPAAAAPPDAKANETPPETAGTPAAPETVQQCITLLSRPDDTSRFVGLALLSSLLTHITSRPLLLRCWAALPPRFLDRLLRARHSAHKTPEEARDMVDLAVGVIAAFATVLRPHEYDAALLGRVRPLLRALGDDGCGAVTTGAALGALRALVEAPAGAGALLAVGAPESMVLVRVAGEQEMAVQVLLVACVNAGAGTQAVRDWLAAFLPAVCEGVGAMRGEAQVRVMRFLAELLTRAAPEDLPDETAWVESLYGTITGLLAARHTSAVRHAAIVIAAALLHRYPPALLFNPAAASRTAPAAPDAGPPLAHFLQLTLITLRASFPSLLESLHTPTYAATSHTLAAAYDITAALLTHLVDPASTAAAAAANPSLPPDTLLKLRTDLTETFSLTLEFLRDRWDAAIAGAEGLTLGHDTTPALPWDTPRAGGLLRDPIIMAAVRALALWLREEEAHRAEAGGLMDCLLGLWARGAEAGVDYRVWVLAALEGVLEEAHGRAQFARYGGWALVFADLARICSVPGGGAGEEELRVGVVEARVLGEVVALGGEVAEEVVVAVVALAGCRGRAGLRLALDAEVVRLAGACVGACRAGVRRRLAAEVRKVKEVARRLVLDLVEGGRAAEEGEVLALVAEVAEELEGLGG